MAFPNGINPVFNSNFRPLNPMAGFSSNGSTLGGSNGVHPSACFSGDIKQSGCANGGACTNCGNCKRA